MADKGRVNMSSIPSFDAVLFNPKSIEIDNEGNRSEAVIKSSSQILEDNS